MAFSAFRMMMAASSQSSGPIVLTDTVYPEVGVLVQNPTGGSGATPVYSITSMAASSQSASNKIQIYSKAKNPTTGAWLTWQPVHQSSGPSLSIAAPLSVGPTPASANVDIAYNTGAAEVCAADDESHFPTGNFINSTNTAIASTIDSHSAGQSATAVRTQAVGTGTQQVIMEVLADTTSAIYLFDQSGSVYQSTAVGPSDISTNMQLVNMTSSLGVVIYNNGSNLIKLATYNISGSTVTFDAASSSGITAISGAKAIPIDSSHVLFVYKKTTNTLGARVVAIATGSSFTFNTEYTCVTNGITDDPIGYPGQFTSGGDYGVTYINGNGQGCVLLMSVSGTTVEFNTPSIYHTSNDVVATTDYYSSYFIGLSTTQAMIAYLIKSASLTSGATVFTRAVTMNLNFDSGSNTWGTTWAGNVIDTQSIAANASGLSSMDEVSLGTDRTFVASVDSAASTVSMWVKDLTYDQGYDNTSQTFTTAAAAGCVALANIGYSGGTSNSQRVLVVYGYSNTTVKGFIASVAQDGTITNGTASNIDTSVVATGSYTVNAINYDTDKTLVLTSHSTGVYATIVTTSGTSISSTTTPAQIYSQTLNSGTPAYMGTCVLDSTHVAVIINAYTLNATYKMLILDLTGGTVSAGSTVNVGTNVSGENGNPDICQLVAGRGIVTFVDNVAANDDYQARTFTWSGTTITLGGTTFAITTGGGAQADHTNQTHCIAINNTEAMLAVHGTNKLFLLTSGSQNSLSVGTGYAVGSNQMAFIKQENYNKLVFRRYNGSNYTYGMAYRV